MSPKTKTARSGFRDLARIVRTVADLERLVEQFREAHPAGHRCAVCDFIRDKDKHHHPAGPSDTLAALHVAAWSFSNLLDGDLGLGPRGEGVLLDLAHALGGDGA